MISNLLRNPDDKTNRGADYACDPGSSSAREGDSVLCTGQIPAKDKVGSAGTTWKSDSVSLTSEEDGVRMCGHCTLDKTTLRASYANHDGQQPNPRSNQAIAQAKLRTERTETAFHGLVILDGAKIATGNTASKEKTVQNDTRNRMVSNVLFIQEASAKLTR